MKKTFVLLIILISSFFLFACDNEYESDNLLVVTSTQMLGDLVKQIGQDKVDVYQMFGPGIDPHSALPTGNEAKMISRSNLVFFNGLNLEAHYDQIADAFPNKVIEVGSLINQELLITKDNNGIIEYDPHIWFDVSIWIEVAKVVEMKLSKYDNVNQEYYYHNLLNYITELENFNEWIISTTNLLLDNQKILVTAHDAFEYFGRAYNFEVYSIGGMSTDSDVTTNDINDTAHLIINNNIKSIFVESTVSNTSINAVIAQVKRQGSNVSIGNELYSDSLGVGIYDNYINAFKRNVLHIMEGLS